MKAIMYHYVRQFDSLHPQFRFLDINNFKKQLDYFEKHFGFVDWEEWIAFCKTGSMPNIDGKVLLTFDDAMSCHYEYVYPELLKRDLWGIFYVPTQPYTSGKILDVHRVHLLCGAFDGEELYRFLGTLISEAMIPDQRRKEFREETYAGQKNLTGVSDFKRLLNYYVDYKFRENLIDCVADNFGYVFDSSNFYIADHRLKEMQLNGMVIGSHTISHPVMSKLSRDEQKFEIKHSFDYLSKMGLTKQKTYCHPYGGFHSFDFNTADLLEEEGVEYSFNVESREIVREDLSKLHKHSLPRFDCNEFAFGSVS
jgi:peptidoglycan/xylan/chitin deacetylase (PgdA/CDA1 family)